MNIQQFIVPANEMTDVRTLRSGNYRNTEHVVRYADHVAALVACEQRVIDDTTRWEPHYVAGQAHGYAAGLDAAREAVSNVLSNGYHPIEAHNTVIEALAAIDALRGER